MTKTQKILFYIFSCFPVLWSAALWADGYFSKSQVYTGDYVLGMFLLLGGLLVWLGLLIYLAWEKKMFIDEVLFNIAICGMGIFVAYYLMSHFCELTGNNFD